MCPEKATKSKKLEADVVVIGGGGAGLPAALTAVEKGAKNVIVVEKRFAPGGDALRCNWIFAVESHLQKKAGVTITRDEIFKKALEWHHYDRVNPRILRALINQTADTIQWLEDEGVEFELRPNVWDPKLTTSHWTKGPGGLCTWARVHRLLYQRCKERGVQFLLRASGKKIRRGADGKVTGVLAVTRDGQEIEIKTGSVILCTGGFSGNKELIKKYFPNYYVEGDYSGASLLTNTGDGIQIAADARAALEEYCTTQRGEHYSGDTSIYNRNHEVANPAAMRVNKRGQRYIQQYPLADGTHDLSGNVLALQPGKIGYAIYDDKIVQRIVDQKRLPQGPRIPLPPDKLPDFRGWLQGEAKKGRAVKISNNWVEIADWIGCDPKVLKATIDEYNSFCDKGYDETFLTDPKYLVPLRNPPYYAIHFHLGVGGGIGPVRINEYMEVLDKNYDPIPGFYAAGIVTAGWESNDYGGTPSGSQLGFSIGGGRIAARNATRYAMGK